jgi:predicted Zn finger-like uncharacterized protein
MILACPFCKARFLISASLFAAGPRAVACARCRHGWRADASDDAAAPAEAKAEAIKSATPLTADAARADTVPVYEVPLAAQVADPFYNDFRFRFWAGVGLAIFIAGAWLVLDRQSISHDRPHIEAVYNFLGLHIYHYGEGLSFTHIRSEIRYDSGLDKLVVEGKIHNGTKNTQQIPDILASAVGSDGKIMQSWQIDAPASNVVAGQDVAFTSSIKAPRDGVAQLNLNFIEPKNE